MIKSIFELGGRLWACGIAAVVALGVGAPGAWAEADGPAVLVGVDVLVEQEFEHLEGRRVGLITNHTGLDRAGRRTLDLLHEAEGVELVSLFSPEHGLFGELDEAVGHVVEPETGLRVWSLYGETRRPTEQMLEGIDTLVFDIQDIGARFYTYISTLGVSMEAAGEQGIRFVVLDRPNPITGRGERVAGPLADEGDLSFVAYRPIPIIHGMTVGELALLYQMHFGVDVDLVVVPMEGWRRDMWWEDTGREWVNPSPAMPGVVAALLYPGVALLEFSNVSVGRGTERPFHKLGAPWIDGEELAAALAEHELPGLRFEPITFTPDRREFVGEQCHGIRIHVTDRDAVDAVRLGLTLAWQLKELYGETFEADRVWVLLRNAEAHAAWQEADDPSRLDAVWAEDLREFKQARRKYLLYE